jgi:RNA polymerase sigma factor (sigma-70 family)
MATAVRRSALERLAYHSRRDAVVRVFLPLADALARRFQRRFLDLIELDDVRQVARFELIRAAAYLKLRCCISAAYLKLRMQGALQHYLRDHGRLVRVSRREHEKGIHPWGNQSLDAVGPGERPLLDTLAAPASEEPVSSEGLGVSADALLQSLPASEAAILRLRVLEGQSLRAVSRELGISPMSVCRHEKAALAGAAGAVGLSASRGRANRPQFSHCGFALADQGADTRLIQVYLGHLNIQHTVRYTATNPTRFEKLWR